jgi:mannose-6-phosphate isomerase-like protein (cupin superfamily)
MTDRVKHIELSKKDERYLDKIQRNGSINQQGYPDHYKDKVVVKPWGYEFLIFENDYVAIWFLMIKKDHSTSMHCHPLKKTSLIVLSGKALCNTFHHRSFLGAGDAVIIDAAVFHSTKALSLDGISVIEVESPPDKLDLVRLEDNYGRESCGYENCSQMVMDNLERYGHFYFDDGNSNGDKYSRGNRFSIGMETYSSNGEFHETMAGGPESVYCVCKGSIDGPNQNTLVKVGEVAKGNYLSRHAGIQIYPETLLMNIAVES